MKTNYLFKILMILMILMISSSEIFAQPDEGYTKVYSKNQTPGDALISFTRIYYTGFALQVVGVGLYVIAQTAMPNADDNTIKTLSIVGGAFALVGTIVEIVSFGSIGKAGRLLNEQQKSNNKVTINFEPTQYGIGIVCRF